MFNSTLIVETANGRRVYEMKPAAPVYRESALPLHSEPPHGELAGLEDAKSLVNASLHVFDNGFAPFGRLSVGSCRWMGLGGT